MAPDRGPRHHHDSDAQHDDEHDEVVEELRELREEKKEQEDPVTAREAFELEAEELGLSEEAGEVGDEI